MKDSPLPDPPHFPEGGFSTPPHPRHLNHAHLAFGTRLDPSVGFCALVPLTPLSPCQTASSSRAEAVSYTSFPLQYLVYKRDSINKGSQTSAVEEGKKQGEPDRPGSNSSSSHPSTWQREGSFSRLWWKLQDLDSGLKFAVVLKQVTQPL